jgi:cytoskeletal protein CcmA (bactofilin family)
MTTTAAAPALTVDEKRLTVGRNICLSGQITACDKLIVEGTVDATLTESRLMEIGQTGVFRGAAEIDEAEIAGQFEGTLTVRGRLLIRASGRVKGEVRYGQIEIELGGVLAGTIETVKADLKVEPAPVAKAAAPRPLPLQEEAV